MDPNTCASSSGSTDHGKSGPRHSLTSPLGSHSQCYLATAVLGGGEQDGHCGRPTQQISAHHNTPNRDAPTRLRIPADGYGLSPQERTELPGVIEQATASCRAFVAEPVAGGDPVYTQALSGHGGWQRWDRMQEWLVAHHEMFTAALLG